MDRIDIGRSLLYSTAPTRPVRPWWRAAHRLPTLATLSASRLEAGRRLRWDTDIEEDGVGLDVTAHGSTNAERVWLAAEHILGDAWQGGAYPRELIAIRYAGPMLGDEREPWVELTADLTALGLVCALLGYLTGEDYSWAWAPELLPETPRWEVA